MSYDVAPVRATFPALQSSVAYFDGPGGSQVPKSVCDAVAGALCGGLANRGDVTDAELRSDEVVLAARAAMADLLGAQPGGVVFGRSMTQVTYDVARALAKQWGPGDEVMVTRLDHDANVRPWVQAAEAVGATVVWATFEPDTAELPVEAVTDTLTNRTRLVAVTAASNLLGTRPDIPAITKAAHDVGALVHVDGVHLTPHAPVDVNEFGADFYACSPYKFFGPHLGVTVADPALWETLQPEKLRPATDDVPERFELGTLPYELLAGTTAAVDFIASLALVADPAGRSSDPSRRPSDHSRRSSSSRPNASRRQEVLHSMAVVEEYEDALFTKLLEGLAGIPGVHFYGSPARRTPTALFSVGDKPSRAVYEFLARRDVNAPSGSFYAIEAAEVLGLGEPGAVRAGLAPYTDESDVERLVAGVAEICR